MMLAGRRAANTRAAALLGRPFNRVTLDLGGELVEAVAVFLDEGLVATTFAHEQVGPGQQQRDVGAGLHRQPVFGLAGGHREARVDHDHRHLAFHRLRELLHLRVVHVLAQVRADQHQAVGVLDVGGLGRADAGAVGEHVAHVARTAALGVGRTGVVDDAPALEHMLEEALAETVVEQGHRFRAVLGLDLVHLLGHEAECFVPAHGLPFLLAAFAHAHERLAQAVGVVVRAHGTGATRAKPAHALRVLGVAFELPQLAVAQICDAAAAPEAHLAEGRDRGHGAGAGFGGAGSHCVRGQGDPALPGGAGRGRAQAAGGQAQESPS